MKNLKTKDIFNKYGEIPLTDEAAEEIEQNLKNFFGLLIKWAENEDSNGFEP